MDPAQSPSTLAFRPQVILVVDDEPEIRAILAATFRRALPELEVVTAESGEAGLTAVKGRAFDLILSDHQMGGMGGLDFLARVRDLQPEGVRVLMTAHPEMDLAVRGVNEHILARFLTKPFRSKEVVAVVSGLLEERRARRMQQHAFSRSMDLLGRKAGETQGAPPAPGS